MRVDVRQRDALAVDADQSLVDRRLPVGSVLEAEEHHTALDRGVALECLKEMPRVAVDEIVLGGHAAEIVRDEQLRSDVQHVLPGGVVHVLQRAEAEDAGVGRTVGDIDHKAVQGHQPQTAVKGARRLGRRLQFDRLLGQQQQGCHAQPLTGFAESRTSRRAMAAKRLQPLEYLAIAIAAKQAQRDDEPDHEPRRQPQVSTAGMAGALQDRLDLRARQDAFQSPYALGDGPLRQSSSIGV